MTLLHKEQARYEEAEPLLLEAVEGRTLKLGDKHPHTQQSLKNLIDLYEAWNKPEKAIEWRKKLPRKEAKTERYGTLKQPNYHPWAPIFLFMKNSFTDATSGRL